jgi:hypothetical protein
MLMEPQLCRQLDGNPASLLYRDALRALGEEMGVPVIRRHTMMREWLANGVLTRAELLSPDGLHMADAGYAKLAEAIAADIVRRADPSRIALDGAAVRGADGQRNRLP